MARKNNGPIRSDVALKRFANNVKRMTSKEIANLGTTGLNRIDRAVSKGYLDKNVSRRAERAIMERAHNVR